MQIGIISDLHANPFALESAIEYFKSKNVEKVLCAGDIVGYSPLVNETIDFVKKHNIESIIGNHDYYVMTGCPEKKSCLVRECIARTKAIISGENLKFLWSLPKQKFVDLEGHRIKIVHGSPFNLLEEYIYPDKQFNPVDYRLDDEDLLILGHTHHQMVKEVSAFSMVNPGSIGQPRDAYGFACFAIYDSSTRDIRLSRLEYDTTRMIRAIEKAGWPAILMKYFCR